MIPKFTQTFHFLNVTKKREMHKIETEIRNSLFPVPPIDECWGRCESTDATYKLISKDHCMKAITTIAKVHHSHDWNCHPERFFRKFRTKAKSPGKRK